MTNPVTATSLTIPTIIAPFYGKMVSREQCANLGYQLRNAAKTSSSEVRVIAHAAKAYLVGDPIPKDPTWDEVLVTSTIEIEAVVACPSNAGGYVYETLGDLQTLFDVIKADFPGRVGDYHTLGVTVRFLT